MSALGYFLEQEGIATVSISLIREHTAAMNPPRALWVPFMLGRPLGVPNDAAFQRKVALSALQLLERDSGPVLEDFPDDAPYTAICGVNAVRPDWDAGTGILDGHIIIDTRVGARRAGDIDISDSINRQRHGVVRAISNTVE